MSFVPGVPDELLLVVAIGVFAYIYRDKIVNTLSTYLFRKYYNALCNEMEQKFYPKMESFETTILSMSNRIPDIKPLKTELNSIREEIETLKNKKVMIDFGPVEKKISELNKNFEKIAKDMELIKSNQDKKFELLKGFYVTKQELNTALSKFEPSDKIIDEKINQLRTEFTNKLAQFKKEIESKQTLAKKKQIKKKKTRPYKPIQHKQPIVLNPRLVKKDVQ
jgi:chromosome segregation ATPase